MSQIVLTRYWKVMSYLISVPIWPYLVQFCPPYSYCTTKRLTPTVIQGCQIWHSNWIRLAPNGTNLGLDLKKSQICPIWGQSDPNWMTFWHLCCDQRYVNTQHSSCCCPITGWPDWHFIGHLISTYEWNNFSKLARRAVIYWSEKYPRIVWFIYFSDRPWHTSPPTPSSECFFVSTRCTFITWAKPLVLKCWYQEKSWTALVLNLMASAEVLRM